MKFRCRDDDRERVELLGQAMRTLADLVYSQSYGDDFDLENKMEEIVLTIIELNDNRRFEYQEKKEPKKTATSTVSSTPWPFTTMNVPMGYQVISLDNCCKPAAIQPRNEDMNTTNDLEYRRGNYLEGRLGDVSDYKMDELRQLYHIDDDLTPNTPKEMIDRITAGKYTIEDKKHYYNSWDGFHWRDPALPADEAGFKTALKQKWKRYQDVKDAIILSPNADALAALKAFEAWLPTPATTTAN